MALVFLLTYPSTILMLSHFQVLNCSGVRSWGQAYKHSSIQFCVTFFKEIEELKQYHLNIAQMNARATKTLIWMARSLREMLAAITAPCSVNA